MKKNILTLLILAMSTVIMAQNEQDALRLSQIYHGGTARSIGMGGATGALGADFSSLSINPAGSGLYRTGDFTLSMGFQSLGTSASYLGEKTKDAGYNMNLDQFGFVIPFNMKNASSGTIKSVNFSFGYNKLRDFSQNIVMQGTNVSSSLVDDFVYTANNNDDWDPFSDELAWETWLIDYDSVGGEFYSDFSNSNYGQIQRRSVQKGGSLGEYLFNVGANVGDKLYFGGSVGIQRLRYDEVWTHAEMDPDDVIDFFEKFSYRNELEVEGSGYNAKFGVIARPTSWVRLGASIHTPTFFRLQDDFSSTMYTDLADGESTHEYNATGDYNYEITTPFRAVGSAAFFYKKMAVFSIDYEFVDYSQAKLSANDYDFFEENQAVGSRYGQASNLRAGLEVVLGPMYVRGGYALYGSPYVSGEENEGNDYSAISGGLGFRSNRMSLDFAVAQMSWDQKYYLYGNNMAELSTSGLKFVGTIGFKF